MATFDYASLQETGQQLITDFGQAAKLRREAGDRNCVVVEADYTPQERNGSTIQFTDRRYIMGAVGLTPPPSAEDDRLVILDAAGLEIEVLRIVTAKRIQPADVPVIYDIQARL